MSLSTLEAYELIRFAEAFEARLVTANDVIAEREGLQTEKKWLAAALKLARTALAPCSAIIERAKDLPELEEAREEFSFQQQNLWVDALEKLHAGITFCASSRAPIIDALFPHLKFPQLRRAPQETVNEFAVSYERRLKSSYVTRIFAQDDFDFVRPVVEQVARAHAAWQASLTPTSLSDSQTAALRTQLITAGNRLDIATRQARLLAEAALVPVAGAFDSTGLAAKPRKRVGRGLPDEAASDGLPDAGPEEANASEELPPPSEAPAASSEPEPIEAAEPPPAPEPPAAPEPLRTESKPARRGRKKADPKHPPDEAA
ncbi:hypothetical protein POL68_07820 [Stigmatella sp. ncwal1]|uniref:Uncharacterized protein n=1 Tax=Stigmatella ashevillensis TaxID=2995309 RepID=A0ABT5D3Y0_9BACT|nr:hypothetical protein [Stigmatella ashevillena]MDC0708371.1 hypothetical protein [Stigmatella ashevillena]